jgi:hypothetical protein
MNNMPKLTLKTLLERKLTKTEKGEREKVAKKLEKGDGWSERYGKRGKAVKMAVATIIAKKKSKKKDKKSVKESYLSEGDVINKENQPMSRAEVAARNKCFKAKKLKGFNKYFKEKKRGGTDNAKERRARACTFVTLGSTRKGKGGALKAGSFRGKKKGKKDNK